MHNKILFIGPISPPVTGPGVKNKSIVESLYIYSKSEIFLKNTLGWSSKPLKFLLSFVKEVYQNKQVIISVSKKGRFVFATLLYFLSKIINIRYIVFPAGGSLDQEINALPSIFRKLFIKSLQQSDMVLVESKALQDNLEKIALSNIYFFPNPRKDEFYRWNELDRKIKRIVFLSKIREGKGVLLLLEALSKVNNKNFLLEYYGPIEKEFEEKFISEIEKYSFAKYCGISEPDEVQKVISNADIYIFPTLFDEGLPGVIVEASFTGVPLITSNFKACDEYIVNNYNGIVVSQNSVDELVIAIDKLLVDKELRQQISRNFVGLSEKFNIEILTKKLVEELKNKGWRI